MCLAQTPSPQAGEGPVAVRADVAELAAAHYQVFQIGKRVPQPTDLRPRRDSVAVEEEDLQRRVLELVGQANTGVVIQTEVKFNQTEQKDIKL